MRRITDRMIVKACVLASIICLIFGACFKYRYRLTEPVFVEQDIHASVKFEARGERAGWYADVQMHYITGRDDDRVVQYIEFHYLNQEASIGNEKLSGSERNKKEVLMDLSETVEIRGEYMLHTLNGRIHLPIPVHSDEEKVVTDGYVVYTDGSGEEIHPGKLVLTKRTKKNRADEAVSTLNMALEPQDGYLELWRYLNQRGVFERGKQK